MSKKQFTSSTLNYLHPSYNNFHFGIGQEPENGMDKFKTTTRLLISTSLLVVCISLIGCATLAVEQFIHHPSSQYPEMFNPIEKEWSGIYTGIEVIDNVRYACVVAIPASADCPEKPTINLLLPIEKNSKNSARLRLGGSEKKQSSTNDQYIGQPVKILFFQSKNKGEINEKIKNDISLIEPNSNWSGYPSSIIVRFNGLYPDVLTYRIGLKTDDYLVREFDCAGECNTKWFCKDKENNVAGNILKPIAVVVDVITVPVQILVITFALIVGGNHP